MILVDNTYKIDLKNIEDFKNNKIKINWKEHSRESYINYYYKNLSFLEPSKESQKQYHFSYINFDPYNPLHDVILAFRVNSHFNKELANGMYVSLSKFVVIEDENGDFYHSGGYLFNTDCCNGWYYKAKKCSCGRKKYLDTSKYNFADMNLINLNSKKPIGDVVNE